MKIIFKKKFCVKNEIFNLKFDKSIKFHDFHELMNINFSNYEIYNKKLENLLNEEGYENIKSTLEEINKFQKKEDPLRYMNYEEFNKYQQKVMDQKGKFMMPLGWGWTYPIIKYSSMILVSLKIYTTLPWFTFIILCGLIIRLIMLPFMVRQMILIQRMAKISPNIRLLSYCTIKCNLPFYKKAYYFTRSLLKYSKEVNVNLFTFAAYNLFQLPVFFIMIFSIRKISYEENLENCGYLWFKNLNEPDAFYILPFISAFLTYINIGRGINKENEKWLINRWRSLFQVLQICYLPFTVLWPSASHIYWLTSTIAVYVQNSIIRHPYIMGKINPTYFIDMQRVFQTERSKTDSERYIEKIKKCEDSIIKAPSRVRDVIYELEYEKTRMLIYQKSLKYKKIFRKWKNSLLVKFKIFKK